MPPAVRFSHDSVLDAAYQLVRRDGPSALNARAVARELGGSTQPIFRLFANMDELYREVIALADRNFCSGAKEAASQSDNPYLSICMNYLLFARDEPQLFKLLFMRDRVSEDALGREYTHSWGCPVIIQSIGVDQETAWKLYERSFFFVHGLATCIATKYLPCMDEEQMHNILVESIQAAAAQLGIDMKHRWVQVNLPDSE